jgi:L,D-peptidoglycan transpeptidase YkuD (ErfK/YbiS/YcfS/YnhG family)
LLKTGDLVARLCRLSVALLIAAGSVSPAPAAEACPPALATATHLVLVVAPDMRSVVATLRRFERASPDAAWTELGKAVPAVVGKGGLGWGWTIAAYAKDGEPVKHEGDKRAPAGVYPLGRPFGLLPAALAGYLKLEPEQSFCVDDVRSPAYGTIVPRKVAGPAMSGEAMWTVPLYRRGLFVDYPANRSEKGGSCVFVHIWRGPTSGTAGCVALAEDGVKSLQAFAKPGSAAIAILPKAALARFAGCLPGVSPP